MTKLKTLKDIEKEFLSEAVKTAFGILKAEAVKWIKFYRSTGAQQDKWKSFAFEHFFNITEEDLKEQGEKIN